MTIQHNTTQFMTTQCNKTNTSLYNIIQYHTIHQTNNSLAVCNVMLLTSENDVIITYNYGFGVLVFTRNIYNNNIIRYCTQDLHTIHKMI